MATSTAKRSTTSSALRSVSREGAVSVMPGWQIDASKFSADHAESIALMPEFVRKVRAQEEMYVAAGFPAEGLTDFLMKWFRAWQEHSVEQLRDCITDDVAFTEPIFGSRETRMRQIDFDMYRLLLRVVPDCVFYPQSTETRFLPYYDFFDDTVRITLPWRMIGRGKFTPRTVKSVGTDRYLMVRDEERGWLIQRCDSDFDLTAWIGQLMPFVAIKGLPEPVVYGVVRLILRVFPKLRGPELRPMVWDKTR